MEQRLIDANALKKALCKVCGIRHYCKSHDDDCWAKRRIDEQPTVDAAPVVHAYWIIKPHGTYDRLRAFCSACGKHSGIGGIVSNQKKPYCPNCGAIMDGKEIVDG